MGASWLSCLCGLVVTSRFCHMKIYPHPASGGVCTDLTQVFTCTSVEAAVGMAQSKCQLWVTEQHRGSGAQRKQRRGWSWAGCTLSGVSGKGQGFGYQLLPLKHRLEVAASLCAQSPPHLILSRLGDWGHHCTHSPVKETEVSWKSHRE